MVSGAVTGLAHFQRMAWPGPHSGIGTQPQFSIPCDLCATGEECVTSRGATIFDEEELTLPVDNCSATHCMLHVFFCFVPAMQLQESANLELVG